MRAHNETAFSWSASILNNKHAVCSGQTRCREWQQNQRGGRSQGHIALRCSNSSGSRDNYDDSNRVGLTFEGVKLVPIEILGVKSPDFLPSLQVDLPTKFINLEDLPGVNPDNLPGYFDVTYLDDDMLIIKQSAPGGYFVSIKVDNCFP